MAGSSTICHDAAGGKALPASALCYSATFLVRIGRLVRREQASWLKRLEWARMVFERDFERTPRMEGLE